MTQLKLFVKASHNVEKSVSNFEFTLSNEGDKAQNFDKFSFTFYMPIVQDKLWGANLLKKQGSYYEFDFSDHQSIEASGEIKFGYELDRLVRHYTDMPQCPFFVLDDEIVEIHYTYDDQKKAIEFEPTPMILKDEAPAISRKINLFPMPNQLELKGGSVNLSNGFTIAADAPFENAFSLAQNIENDLAGGFDLLKENATGAKLNIKHASELASEAYQLDITAEGVEISANDQGGVHNALMSLWQIAVQNPANTPCLKIEDEPRFEYRGQHLDVARTFFTVDEVKRIINHMALYKLNKFHWHLIDDEGWRIEIKGMPELTEELAYRGYHQVVEPQFGSGPHKTGGFYTQEEMKDVVAYARDRNIEVIPEIDVPGHCYGLVKLKPELLETDDKSEYESVQGYKNNVLNPGLDATYDVMDAVISETAAIFESEYIHMGADERAEGSWERSEKVADLMAKNGFNSTEQVQTYFLKQVQSISKKYGKRTGAWEEAAQQGDIDKSGFVVSWRGTEAGIDAIERGFDVVMAPVTHCYFDIAQSYDFSEPGLSWSGTRVGLYEAYIYNPIPDDFPKELHKHFKGVQGCLWAENFHEKDIVDYQLFPRMIALSEVAWSNMNVKNYNGFLSDLGEYHTSLLDRMEIDYRKAYFEG